jgi:DNA-binding response OmpR family regulator
VNCSIIGFKRERWIYMDNARILLVDDEERIRDMIKEYTSLEDYDIDEASNGIEALELFKKHKYSLIILDVMMPKIDGYTVCRKIRKTSNVPVIMLTARGEEYDKLFGFELGVDDYIIKPFSPKELLARMKAIIRRSSSADLEAKKENIVTLDGLVVDFDSRNTYVNGNIVTLTPKEYSLLTFLIKNSNRVFSREQLLNEVWGYDFIGDDRTVDTHIKMLRVSIKEYRKYIVTVWGTGYKFEVSEKNEKHSS